MARITDLIPNLISRRIGISAGPEPVRVGSGGGNRGFTIVEILIALFLTAIISASIYAVYNSYYRQSNIQDMALEAQQNARVAINLMEREMVNAGYDAGTPDIITEANSNSIEFIYTDPSDSTMSATAGNRLKVKYALQTTGGVQYLARTVDNLSNADPTVTGDVIPYVQSFTVTYYDINGAVISDTTSQANRNTIMFITINLVTETKENIQGTAAKKTFTLETHIRLRNIGIGQVATDTSAPDPPGGVQVREDGGLCARLKVKWTENTEGDISGYRIYYGTSSGDYTGVINIPLTVLSGSTYSCTSSGGSMSCDIFPIASASNPALDHTPSDGSSITTYYIALRAYDNSLNSSVYSAEVGDNPDPSNSTYDTGSDDSTINPVKPAAVTFSSATGPGDGQVYLSWTASSSTDVTGYRIYRSTSQFSSYPIDPTASDIDWIAGEPGTGLAELNSSATSYTDTESTLLGCNVYYYAIAPVNCDTTLVTDDSGDTDSDRYIQADYDATCGDGTNSCTPGSGFAAITGSDTAPSDSTNPAAPTPFTARAGWKRVSVGFKQPSDSDLGQTCIYGIESSSSPSLLTSIDADGCYNISDPGKRLPESGGIFDTTEVLQGDTKNFWNNSIDVLTSTPSLDEIGTYSYSAVSFDLCGNASTVQDAQATTTLCGEDPPGKPPAVTALSASACGGTPDAVSLSWTEVPSDVSSSSSSSNPWDLAGYRIFRATTDDATGWSNATLLNSAPYWGGTYTETGTTDGGTYYYRVVSTDCPYEKGDDTGGIPTEDQIRDHMNSGFLSWLQYGPVYPGRIERDEKSNATQDLHREVLTGVTVDYSTTNGDGTSTPSSAFTHGTVTLFLGNTSAGTMTIQSATVSWVSSSAFLREIKVGGGSSSTTSIAAGSTTTVTGNAPYTSAASNIALATAQIAAGARYVPITFEFRDSSDNAIDMRLDQLLITLDVQNDATGTTTCLSYLTGSKPEVSEGVSVPLGPSVTATQQDQPSSPTFGYAVPGTTGLNTVPSGSDGSIVVDSGFTVTVSTSVTGNTTDPTDGSKVPVSSASLYYIATANTVTTMPTSGFTAVTMSNSSGSTWTGAIIANDGQRVWYYIVAIDADGNYDRDPEIGDGAYVYDQKGFDVCDVTPEVPTGLTASASGSDVTLTWTAPTTYTNTASIDGSDTIKYRVFRGGTQIAADVGTTSYTDSGLADGVYSYTVRATNSCSTPNVSSDSNTAAECVGALAGSFTLDVTPASIFQGGSYTVTIVDCEAIEGTNSSSVEVINTTAEFLGFTNTSGSGTYNPTITETGVATGTFSISIGTTDDVMDSTKLLVGTTDTITVGYAPPLDTAQSTTVSVTVDACSNTPKAPTIQTGSVTGNTMTPAWTAVTLNTDDTGITDLAGYRVYEKVCADDLCAVIEADWFLRTTVGSGVTSVALSADYGNVNQRVYFFKVTAIDTCSTPVESADSSEWNETN
jgi:prepilin-type N-terminal cleavage/methylation domain-containing protein